MTLSTPASPVAAPGSAGAAVLCVLLALGVSASGRAPEAAAGGGDRPVADEPAFRDAAVAAKATLRAKHGPGEAARIDRGVDQVLRAWRAGDGDAPALRAFLEEEFVPAGAALDGTFDRFERATESFGGYFTAMVRDLRTPLDVDIGPLLPIDRRFGAYNPAAHLSEDLFASRIAFVALLNFPVTTLDQRLRDGAGWSRRAWAETRLAAQFTDRVPAAVSQGISAALADADSYISGYNIYMHHVVTPDGKRLYPAGMRLISHWNLRDELKARYAEPDGLPAQRLMQKVMERIVTQEIPAAVVNNPRLDWDPAANTVAVSPVKDAEPPAGAASAASSEREPDTRYARWLAVHRAHRAADPYHPDNPTFIDRRFNVNREIPEAQVRTLFETVLASPLGARTGALIEKRLGRRLEPFDIWYAGFKPRSRHQEADLDAMTRKRYPTADAYAADIPRLLRDLGFSEERARFVAGHIVVDPSRGAGHAFGAARRDDKAHLRTRVGPGGMDYKGYNIAVHEMGHNVEQVFSLTTIDHILLQGVPNNAFTEALAFVFQARDLELLGLGGPDADSERARALEEFWATREIAGVSLVDMGAWRWLYEHPGATPAEFRAAVVGIAKEIWNRHYAPIFGVRDVTLLGVYSHMIDSALYLPDYTLGHMIAFQVEAHFRGHQGAFGAEFERICRIGSLTPDVWMRQAVGAPLSPGPLLEAAEAALSALGT